MLANEPALIDAARAGSEPAFTTLALYYRDRLLRFLIVRGQTQADAEDAAQDALVNAWRYLPTYDNRWRFSTWLYRIALRRIPRAAANVVALTGDEAAPAQLLRDVERDNLWRLAQQHLSRDACSALWLKYAEDLSISEIAGVMGRSQSAVKVGLMRSRNTLAAIAQEQDDDND
ncbi:MAG: sigma-70 family RNA polymerase sigma factor [Pseudomonadota bacterium]